MQSDHRSVLRSNFGKDDVVDRTNISLPLSARASQARRIRADTGLSYAQLEQSLSDLIRGEDNYH